MMIDPYPWSAPLEEVRLKNELKNEMAIRIETVRATF